MAVSGQSNFGKFIEAAEWAAELSGEAQLILRGLETHVRGVSVCLMQCGLTFLTFPNLRHANH